VTNPFNLSGLVFYVQKSVVFSLHGELIWWHVICVCYVFDSSHTISGWSFL